MRWRAAAWTVAASVLLRATASSGGEPLREPMGYGAAFAAQDLSCGGVAKRGIFAHPPWNGAKGRVVGQFDVHLNDARSPRLTFFMGIRDGHGSDRGVIYRVSAAGKELWSEFHDKGEWKAVEVDLAALAGTAATLELAVDSLGEHYACWGEPWIVEGGRVLYDLADLAGGAKTFVDLMDSVPEDALPLSMKREKERERRESASVRPSPRQLAWQEMEFILFAHFGVNTFTDREWGDGREDPAIFNPTAFDAGQWVRVARDSGARMIILTAKLHDGFCLWPSKHTDHSVKRSPWRGGKGDVVREVSEACREGGIAFGVYVSPWDRHERSYGESARYNEHFKSQLRELLTGYGPIAEVWFDGACAKGPSGKRQAYDWAGYYAVIRELQPDTVIAICGPDVRWVGNESGVARETEWSVQRASPATHGREGLVWWPAECDVSIRPGWFYHAHEDGKVKSLAHLVDIYYRSVGRNSVLLLNVPPDRRGLFHENDAARLRELRGVLDRTFAKNLAAGARASSRDGHGPARAVDDDPATYFAAREGAEAATITFDLREKVTFNRSMVREHIPLGQRIGEYVLEAWDGRYWREFARGTTVGYRKLDRFEPVMASRVRLRVTRSRAPALIRELGLYTTPPEG